MQHNEVEEESFVAPDTQGDEDSPFADPSQMGSYQAKSRKKPKLLKPRNEKPTLISHTEPGDVIQVEGALFIVVRKAGQDRWVRTWLQCLSNPELHATDYKTGPYHIPGAYVIDQIIQFRPTAWR